MLFNQMDAGYLRINIAKILSYVENFETDSVHSVARESISSFATKPRKGAVGANGPQPWHMTAADAIGKPATKILICGGITAKLEAF